MSDKKKLDEDKNGEEMDIFAAQQIVSGVKEVLYNEDYKPKDDEDKDRELRKSEDEDKEQKIKSGDVYSRTDRKNNEYSPMRIPVS